MGRASLGHRRIVALAAAAILAAGAALGVVETQARGTSSTGLRVAGNRLVNRAGQRIVLQGVNRSGTEYACVQKLGIFDGPSNARSVAAIASWHVNIVRIPINEDCWLGINGVSPRDAGARYRQAIVDYVQLLHRDGMYAEISLIWAAPGADPANYQDAAPDEDHSPAVWASMAATFKGDPDVILAPWGETAVDAGCFLHGGCTTYWGPPHSPYRVAGMQQAVDVMRAAGYDGVIAIPGTDYANSLSQWLSFMPRDPLHQLIAEAHVYGDQVCSSVSCFNATYAPVARRVPVIFGETGEDYTNQDCGTDHIRTIVGWAQAHDIGLEAWAWDTWHNCGILIANYAGAPFSAYGAFIRADYQRRHPQLLGRG